MEDFILGALFAAWFSNASDEDKNVATVALIIVGAVIVGILAYVGLKG